MSIRDWLLNPTGLTPHGFCLSWSPGLVSLHAASDAVIGLAYFSIPLMLAVLVRQRPDLQYGWVIYLFVAFILACGASHLSHIVTLWIPAYGIEGLIKLVTAVLSIATAAILWRLSPKLLALPSPAQLEALNADLTEREAQVRAANVELERHVAERTSQLEAANAQLSQALAERTAVQEALIRSEEQFRVSFDGASVGKTQVDPVTGRFIRVNRAFADMLGYEPEELTGRISWEFSAPEEREPDQAAYAAVLAGDAPSYVREKRYIRKDGERVWGRISANVVRRPGSMTPIVTVAVIENIDERKKAEQALEIARRELEETVEARTSALAQRDLLLREVYHRVKNNLQVIDGMLVLQARELSDPVAKSALLSLRSRVYALGLVHHQLMGSDDLRTFDIAPFLQELSENLVDAVAGREIALSVRAATLDVGLDFAIPLGLLVTELVTNSLKHAFPDGRGEVEVVLEREGDGGLILIVADNGSGGSVASGAKPERSAARPALGMRIIEGLVAQLKGKLVVRSENGTRSEIRIAEPVLS